MTVVAHNSPEPPPPERAPGARSASRFRFGIALAVFPATAAIVFALGGPPHAGIGAIAGSVFAAALVCAREKVPVPRASVSRNER